MPCPHASLIPPAPRFINPPSGLFRLRRCLGHHTRLSTAQCKFFFFYRFAFAHSCFVVPSCRVPSLMPCLLSCAASVLSCHIFTPTHAASTPLPLAYPGCIDIPTSACRVGCLGHRQRPSTARCALCTLCPHPLLRPYLALCVRLCMFLCDCAPATLHVLGLDCIRCDEIRL